MDSSLLSGGEPTGEGIADADPFNDEELDWDGQETATAWSRAQKARGTGRVVRTFGNRGRTGRTLRRSTNSRHLMKSSSFQRLEDTISSGYMADEKSSPSTSGVSERSSSASFASSTTVTDLFNTKPPRHARSASVSGSTKATASSKLSSFRPPRILHRSNSISMFDRETSSSTINSDDNIYGYWEENSNPNDNNSSHSNSNNLDDVEKEGRERKKPRARRHSATGHVAPLSDMRQRSLTPDPTLSWLPQSATSKLQRLELDCRELSDLPIQPSPEEASVSSSRKRLVCGSPRDLDLFQRRDSDDWSSTCLNLSQSMHSGRSSRGRSRSRIFSPEPSEQESMPMVPSLKTNMQRGTNDMDVDSDDGDDEESGMGTTGSPDNSFTSGGSTSHHKVDEYGEGNNNKEEVKKDSPEYILEKMSSYDDLKFLIKALRKENNTKLGKSSFGGCHSWNVPPPRDWSSARRSAFLMWTKTHLGFTVRAVDVASTYLQIPRSRGEIVLTNLEAALVAYKQRETNDSNKPGGSEEVFSMNGLIDWTASASRPVAFGETATSVRKSAATTPASFMNTVHASPYDEAANLAAELESLTFKESSASSSKKSLVRLVTLDPQVPNLTGRPSIDHHVQSTDLMSHLHGLSPNAAPSFSRPPKMSLGSVSSTTRPRLSVGSTTPSFAPIVAPPIQNLEIIGTPLMEDFGWGSRPVPGRDWGSSNRCETSILDELTARLEASCRLEGIRESFGSAISDTSGKSSSLTFDMLGAQQDVVDEKKEMDPEEIAKNERKQRRRMVSFKKHKRMSLWASTTQPEGPLVPKQKPLFRKNKSLGRIDENLFQSLEDSCSTFQVDDVSSVVCETGVPDSDSSGLFLNEEILPLIFSYMTEQELMCNASLVCTAWADAATTATVNLMLASVGYSVDDDNRDPELDETESSLTSRAASMERSWSYLNSRFPWGCFLSEGAFKRVYKVHNSLTDMEEAISVMDTDAIVDKKTVAAELAVSAMLSSLTRRGICPNFVLTRGVFTCPYEPPESYWGSAENKRPKGSFYVKGKSSRKPREPREAYPGRFQYIRMELCNEGDAEEYMKRLPDELVDTSMVQAIMFQIAFALHAAADRFSVKHYDIKLLNIFLQRCEDSMGSVILRYGLGSHVFALNMPSSGAVIAKLADFGTANTSAESTGQPVTIAQFTTLENTPPEFMILGDYAKQGHSHDCFGLGLCMLHMFTGHAPYEEILEDVKCPSGLKKRLRKIWEDEKVKGYKVIRSVILSDVYKDEAGHIIDGEPDETLYDTFYRFLVLFGIPEVAFEQKKCPKVWQAVYDSLQPSNARPGKPVRMKQGTDSTRFSRDCRRYSIRSGNNKYVSRARKRLQSMEGGMDLLFRLCSFDPSTRASAIEALNSPFFDNLREPENATTNPEDTVFSYNAFSTFR